MDGEPEPEPGQDDRLVAIQEDGNDTVSREATEIANLAAEGAASVLRLGGTAVPLITPDTKAGIVKQEVKRKMDSAVTEGMDRMTDMDWAILHIMGSRGENRITGISRGIVAGPMGEKYRKREETQACLDKRMRESVKGLEQIGAIDKEILNTPLVTKALLLMLNDKGKAFYRAKYNKEPVESERQKVVKTHDNVEHGYGILSVGEQLRKNQMMFQDVKDLAPRGEAKIATKYGDYIPDISYKYNGKKTQYIEYECGNTPQQVFEVKCKKMMSVSNYVDFVSPNEKAKAKLMQQIDIWIGRMDKKVMDDIIVRVSTPKVIRENVETGQIWANQWRKGTWTSGGEDGK